MSYNGTLKNAKKFGDIWNPMPYFHLRPTAKSVTLVCTIPEPRIAMRGKQDVSQKFIKEKYNELLNITLETAGSKLKELEFNDRESGNHEAEKLIQAMFINLIFSDKNALADCGYTNISFIASELVYPIEGKRKMLPDVVADAAEGILLIEIKKGKDINSGDDIEQLLNYKRAYFDDNRDRTIELLKSYPNHQLTKDKPVILIYLLNASDTHTLPSVAKKGIIILRFNIAGEKITVHK